MLVDQLPDFRQDLSHLLRRIIIRQPQTRAIQDLVSLRQVLYRAGSKLCIRDMYYGTPQGTQLRRTQADLLDGSQRFSEFTEITDMNSAAKRR